MNQVNAEVSALMAKSAGRLKAPVMINSRSALMQTRRAGDPMARVYVSSTFGDLQDHRKAVNEVLRDLGHDDVAMEHYVAEDRPPLERCLDDIASCDLYIILVAWRYGSLPPDREASYTHLEFQQAEASKLTRLAFLLDPDVAWPPSNVDDPRDRVTAFRNEVLTGRLASTFTSVDDLRSLVIRSVRLWEDRRTAEEAGLPPAGGSVVQVLRTVPGLEPDFTGRAAEIAEAIAVLEAVDDSPAPVIVTITGPPSVGKSQLAVRVARDRRVIETFPDGQLYLNLRGYDGQPVEADLALRLVLQDLGVPFADQPTDEQVRERLYHSYFEDRRRLLILDDARSEAQVESLLPKGGTSGVILTSRRRLQISGTVIRLAPLSTDDGLDFLAELVGEQKIEAEPDAARLVVERCSGFPLAIRMAGSLAARRQLTLATIAERLATDDSAILGAPADPADTSESAQASFSLSYQSAPPHARELLLRLSLFELSSVGIGFAAQLAGSSTEAAEDTLWQLADEHLLEPLGDGLFKIHDLLRHLASAQFYRDSAESNRDTVQARGIEWYVATAERMNDLLHPVTRREQAAQQALTSGVDLADVERALEQLALNWFTSEILNIITIARMAAARLDHRAVMRLAIGLRSFLALRGTSSALAELQELGLAAARQEGKRLAEAQILNNLALLRNRQGRDEEALELLDAAISIGRELGDAQIEGQSLAHRGSVQSGLGRWRVARDSFRAALQIGQESSDRYLEGRALLGLGLAAQYQGQWDEAFDCYEQALRIKRELGDRHGEYITLSSLSTAHAAQGRWNDAFELSEQARLTSREAGDFSAEGIALTSLGQLYSGQGNWPQAIEHSERAVAVWQQLGDRRAEAGARINLGSVYVAQERWQEAMEQFHEALAITQELNDQFGSGQVLSNLSIVSGALGHWDEAVDFAERALAIYRQSGNAPGEGQALMNLGLCHMYQESWDEADSCFRASLKRFRDAGLRPGEAQCLMSRGLLLAHQERWQEALACQKRARTIWQEMANRPGEGQAVWNMGLVEESRGDFNRAGRFYDEALAIFDPSLPQYGQLKLYRDLLGVRSRVSKFRTGISRFFREAES